MQPPWTSAAIRPRSTRLARSDSNIHVLDGVCGLEIEVEVGNLGELLGGRIRTKFAHGGWDTVKRVFGKVLGPKPARVFRRFSLSKFPPSGDHPSPAVCSCVGSVL